MSGVNRLFDQIGRIVDNTKRLENAVNSIEYNLIIIEFLSMVSNYLRNINQIKEHVYRIISGERSYQTPFDAYKLIELIPVVIEANIELHLNTFADIQPDPLTFLKLTWSYLDLDHTYSLITFIPLTTGETFTTLEIHPFSTHINKEKQYSHIYT